MIVRYGLRGVPVGGSRELRLRSLAEYACVQRHTLLHVEPPAEEKPRKADYPDGRIVR